jgi:predicted DNA-binding transcriptional regulator YafY
VKLLNDAWGVGFENEIETVKLYLKPSADISILETRIHPSQTIEMLEDGSVIISLKVRDSVRFQNWILGWGDSVEVLEPQTLRNQIRDSIKLLSNIYGNSD